MTTRPSQNAPAGQRQRFHALRVEGVRRLCDDAVEVAFDVPEKLAGDYAFRPGQFLTLRRAFGGRVERRSYSICSPTGAAPRIGVREVPGGLFSGWLVRHVVPGEEIEVSPPAGRFTPDLAAPAHHVLIAAGSGITPMLSIIKSALDNPGTRVTLLYGNRRTDTVMFADDLADLKDAYLSRLHLAHVLSQEPHEAELLHGRLDATKLRRLLPIMMDPQHVDQWWLCGPLGMVTEAQQVLAELRVERQKIHRELFFADNPPTATRHEKPAVDGPGGDVTVVLDGRSTTVRVPRGVTILESAQRTRADLPFACKSGVCGTCRAKVVRGTVDMARNFALDEAEVAAGFVLTCQSFVTSAGITVDFDA